MRFFIQKALFSKYRRIIFFGSKSNGISEKSTHKRHSCPKITAATITTLSYLNTELPEDPRDITPEQWEAMKAVDIRSVDPSELVDLSTVQIDSPLPVRERVQSYLKQVKNPYCVRVGGFAVKINYKENGPSFEEVFKHLLQHESMM